SLGPAPLDDARLLAGLPLAVFALGVLLARPTAAGGLLAVWGVTSWLMFAWYVPIAAGERFILPLLAPILILASVAIAKGCSGTEKAVSRKFIACGVVWALVWVAATWCSTGYGEAAG